MNAAEIILQQLGGHVFVRFTGSRNFIISNNGNTLTMHLAANQSQAKYLRITLTGNDDYKMEFLGEKGRKYYSEIFTVQTFTEIYAEQLQETFTEVTGLNTTLPKKKDL